MRTCNWSILFQCFNNIIPYLFDQTEIILEDLEEFNPFRRFLIRSLNAILEFDKMIAFVFRTHILFLGKEDNQMRVHMRPEPKKSLFDKIFGRG